ncbi:ATP-binding protein [Mediterraneibacter gnavus]|uniref:ATP-binding protein n=1 Tax=Mediterraneibacter gnavus TaxID=33038 RepID=UPI00232CC242|nr:AAA family ATPase [Mediterraneibacter gnavus]MDB8711189.1 AAA family ATPase [Mediterraneibacter gnavus]MDB8714371.1 AAA family ATPase [Mediterraneibacter gnavus]
MKIKEIEIKNFGKFSNERFVFRDGIQVFYGENEFGKSTIYGFLKSMLFGMERGRGKAAHNDAFSRFEPWENPNEYAGTMRFSCGGKTFCLKRRFDRYTKGAVLICEDDGEELSVEHGDLDMLLNGLTAEQFENTAAIGQLGARPGQSLAAELQNYAANYYETGNSGVDLSGAEEYLKKRKKEITRKWKQLESEKAEKRQALQRKYQYIHQEKMRLESEMQEKKRQLADLREPECVTEEEKKKISWQIIAAMCLLAVGVILHSVYTLIPVMVSILFLIWGIKDAQTQKSVWIKERETMESGYREKKQKLHWTLQRIGEEQKEKQISLNNVKEQLEELDFSGEEEQRLKKTARALEIASETMEKAAASMSKDFGTVLNEKASKILAKVTDGKYTRLLIEDSLKLILLSEGRRIPAERVSRGTVEQVYFALRMAALEILYGEEVPVILDDAFGCYDEKRLKYTLKWLSEQSRQVIIFSCQKRELEILNEIEMERQGRP